MDALFSLVCIISLVVPAIVGVGIAFVLERYLGRWAYVAGGLLPVIVFAGLYTLYHIWIRATPCEPVGSLVCGEPLSIALFLFLVILLVVILANALAQGALYLFLQPRGTEESTMAFEEPQPQELA
jgi:hypothetical protein